MMICVVIKGPTYQEADQQISRAQYADLIELRLDCFISIDRVALKALRSRCSLPMIFTLRSQIQGGSYSKNEENRMNDILQLLELRPEYFDIESHVSLNFLEKFSSNFPETKLILSYHNFSETPEDLDTIYYEMQKTPAFFYKIAVTANSCLEALRFICWTKKIDQKLIAISMGVHGQFSRILGPMIGCPITYAALEEEQESAPGQLSAKVLVERYHYRNLHPGTTLYGLIGNPIDQSISDVTHNCLIKAFNIDAVYVKIQVSPAEIPDFLLYAKHLPFHGISVTMPLKEHILPFLDVITPQAQAIGAVNTLQFKEGKIYGSNTDGIGALNAIEKKCRVKGKRIVMIGAGGSTKAIAYEAKRRGGFVTIVNRDEQKAFQLGQRLDCIGKGIDYMVTSAKLGYDILINCTPVSLPIESESILPGVFVMDIKTKPKETEFLKIALEKKCSIIFGYKMFIEQALGQFKLWFINRIDILAGRKILEKKALDCISDQKKTK